MIASLRLIYPDDIKPKCGVGWSGVLLCSYYVYGDSCEGMSHVGGFAFWGMFVLVDVCIGGCLCRWISVLVDVCVGGFLCWWICM